MNPFDRIQLVVLSYNRLDCLSRLFDELLLPAIQHGVSVIFVDNASEIELRRFLSQYDNIPNLEFVLPQENLGVAGGRNLGFKRSDREFVVYLDDDSLMTLDAMKRVPTVFDEIPTAGILAFRIIDGVSGASQNEHGLTRIPVGNFHGAAHAIRKSIFTKVGYLDEYCFFGAEEIEFSMRTCAAGFKTFYIPDIQARHYTFKRHGNIPCRRQILWARNYAMVLFRYLPYRTAALFSLRLFVSHFLSMSRYAKLKTFRLPFAMFQGAFKGLRTRNPLNANDVAFYSNPNTMPEIGNVSITSKVLRSFFRSSSNIK